MEMELNYSLTFDQAAMAKPEVRRAFIGGKPETKERLLASTKLFKWTQYPLVGPKGITPWWSFVEDRALVNGKKVDGLRQSQIYAQRLGAQDSRYARTRSAVTQQWNQMTKPLVIELMKNVWGFIGKASGQPEDKQMANVYLIGGAYQVWIPNLTIAHIRQVAALPYLMPNHPAR